jgi:hypothetical protein
MPEREIVVADRSVFLWRVPAHRDAAELLTGAK